MKRFIKRREPAAPGSIPDVLGMFTAEVRFSREIAPHVGVRVPVCVEASEGPAGPLLVLEDLSDWAPGADPVAAALVYAELHGRFLGVAEERWPWLRRGGDGAALVGALYDRTWPALAARHDLPTSVRRFGAGMVGHAADAERASAGAGPLTLIHGDAASLNQRTGPEGEIALLDWEDVSAGRGITDIAWFLVSSVDPERWEEVLGSYADTATFATALPFAMVQGLLSFTDTEEGSEEADAWTRRLHEAAIRL